MVGLNDPYENLVCVALSWILANWTFRSAFDRTTQRLFRRFQ